ncbi:hypothetical protein PIIN_05654 [Serendipita indica DSM 11827]|uniref:Uncharacterized protein n=1 Tax=Serendipita indica (strain DSM 11827) TaxID=1109443 RepID=G4TK76_SERID|nr:hypothetical protein PIIN_05654 [Serendipita indica DSM 11827]
MCSITTTAEQVTIIASPSPPPPPIRLYQYPAAVVASAAPNKPNTLLHTYHTPNTPFSLVLVLLSDADPVQPFFLSFCFIIGYTWTVSCDTTPSILLFLCIISGTALLSSAESSNFWLSSWL